MSVVDPTAHFQQSGSGIQHGNNIEENLENDGEFLPIIRILDEEHREMRNLGVERLKLRVKFLNPPERNESDLPSYNRVLSGWLDRAFTALLHTAGSRLNIRPSDRVGLQFIRGDYDTFSISFRRFDQYSSSVIISAISRILQSNAEYLFDENLTIELTHIRSDVGYGKTYRLEGCSTEKFAKIHRRSVHLINPLEGREYLCLSYALILGIAHVEGNKNEFIRLTYPPNIDIFTQKALELCENANVDLSHGGGIEELQLFQSYFQSKYNIIVFKDRKGRSLFYRGHEDDTIQKIYLLLENEHYLLITSIHAAFSINFYCDQCLKSSNMKICHRDCPFTCLQCYSKPPCPKTENKLYCNNCNRTFYGLQCFSKHIWKKNVHSISVCDKYKVCPKCFVSYIISNTKDDAEPSHICGKFYCTLCRCERDRFHHHFIPPLKTSSEQEEEVNVENGENRRKRKKSDSIIFVFFDFETVQNKLLAGETTKFEHKVNLAIAQQTCEVCKINEDVSIDCENCGKREHIFIGENSLELFMEYLVNSIDKKFTKVICLAHFLKGFDGQFCLRYMYTNNSKWSLDEKSVIINGTKIMKISAGRYTFLDSLNYLCSSLSKLPKMFNINYKKGWFPHLFHTYENMNYVGPYPNETFYSPDSMSTSEREEFLEWYRDKVDTNVTFCLKSQLIEYCKIDVDILRIACMRFRTMLMDKTKVDPFNGPITIASTCMQVFRTMYLKPDTIAIIPWNGYRRIDNQSIKALQWLHWMSYKSKSQIQMADNGREFRLPINIKVDGFCEATNTVFEFLGNP